MDEVKITVGVLTLLRELPIMSRVLCLFGTSTVGLGRGVPVGLRFCSTNEKKLTFRNWLEAMFVSQHAFMVERAFSFFGEGTSTSGP